MRATLPIPAEHGGRRIVEAEVQAPRAADIADTRRQVDQANVYEAMATFLGGGVAAFFDADGGAVDDKAQVRAIARHLPFRSAEWLAINVVLAIDPDEGIEGVYECPRCHHEIVCEASGGDDSRDMVSDMELVSMEPGAPLTFSVDLPEPFQLLDRKSGEVLMSIETLEMAYPTLAVCSGAYGKYGANDPMRRQFAFYVDSLVRCNGEEVDKKFRAEWGMYLFSNLRASRGGGMSLIGEEVRRYGLDQTLEKVCPRCGKVWRADVDTSNFFVSALRSL